MSLVQQARDEFIRKNLHLLAQLAFFFEDETWEVLGIQHDPVTGTHSFPSLGQCGSWQVACVGSRARARGSDP